MWNKFFKKEDYSFTNVERSFVTDMCLAAAIICFIAMIINACLGFPPILILVNVFATVLFVWLFLMAKKGKYFFFVKSLVTLIGTIVINLLVLYNYGSHGAAPYFFLVILSFLIFIWQGTQLFIVLGILTIDALVLFYLDYTYPELMPDCPSRIDRVMDSWTGLFMFMSFVFILLNRAKNNLIKQYEKAKSSDMLKSSFLANISHEIRTPMNAIIGFSQLLKDKDITEEEKDLFIDTINEQGEHLLSLINDVIDISKIETGALTIRDDVSDLNKIIESMSNSFHYNKQNGVKIHVAPNNELAGQQILVDEIRLKQVLTNLLTNAMKFTLEGHIELGYQLINEKTILIYVKDTGIGIPHHDIENIFERFYQVEIKNKAVLNKGTGLGLAITRALIRQMGGDIWVESEENTGSIFSFTIPFKSVNNDKTKIQSSPIVNLKNCTILFVSKSEQTYQLLEPALAKMNGKLVWKKAGKEAITFVEKYQNVDIVLIDLNVPGMDGYMTTQLIKEIILALPVIGLTINVNEDVKEKAEAVNFDGIIAKPVRIDQLTEMMIKHLP